MVVTSALVIQAMKKRVLVLYLKLVQMSMNVWMETVIHPTFVELEETVQIWTALILAHALPVTSVVRMH